MFSSYYNTILKQDLLTKFNYTNVLEIAKLEKIVLNFSVSQASLKTLLPIVAALQLVSYQKPYLLRSKKINLQLRIRRGNPIGCKVDLRGKTQYFFLEKLSFFLLPRAKEFLGFDSKKKAFFLRIPNLFFFKEIEKEYEHFSDLPSLNVSILFRARTSAEVFSLLSSFKLPLKNKND